MYTKITLLLDIEDYSWRSSLISVFTVRISVCIFECHLSVVKPVCSDFKVIATNFEDSRKFWKIHYIKMPMHTAICTAVKIDTFQMKICYFFDNFQMKICYIFYNFQMKICYIFLIFNQNIDIGTRF